MRQASFYLLPRAWLLSWKEITVWWTTVVVIKPLIRGKSNAFAGTLLPTSGFITKWANQKYTGSVTTTSLKIFIIFWGRALLLEITSLRMTQDHRPKSDGKKICEHQPWDVTIIKSVLPYYDGDFNILSWNFIVRGLCSPVKEWGNEKMCLTHASFKQVLFLKSWYPSQIFVMHFASTRPTSQPTFLVDIALAQLCPLW
jgi:hypothetical protein